MQNLGQQESAGAHMAELIKNASLRARRVQRTAALAATVVCLTAACGQKSGVYDPAAPQTIGSLGSPGASYAIDPETGEVIPVQETGTSTASSESSPIAHSGTTSTASGSGTAPAPEGDVDRILSAPEAPVGGDATGIDTDTIKIGMHFPKTGGSPAMAISAQSIRIYYEYLRDSGQTINGRNIELIDMDDKYSAVDALSACKEMVVEDRVFLLVGYAGPHSIRACARYAARMGVPYLAPGSSEHMLAGLDTHFSLSMPYNRQVPMLADLLVERFDARGKQNAFVRVAGPEPPASYTTAREAMAARGAPFVVEHVMDQQGSNLAQMQSIVVDLKQRGVDNVWFAGSPDHLINFAHQAGSQGYRPQLVGYGPTVAYDFTLKASCENGRVLDGATFLHPAPAFDDRNEFDRDFDEALGATATEIDWLFWGLSKPIVELLRLPGRDLTRERFLWYTARARGLETGVFPPLSFSPSDHFTDHSMHLLEADCAARLWRTEEAFYKG